MGGLQATDTVRGMSRDQQRARGFALANELVADVHRATAGFPVEEKYGLQAQIRRGSASANVPRAVARSPKPKTSEARA